MAPQFLPPCVCTASFSLLSSTAVQLPLRALARSLLGSKTSRHLSLHCNLVHPGTSEAIATKCLPPCQCLLPCISTASSSLLSSSALHLPTRSLALSMLGFKTSCHLVNTAVSFGPEPTRQLQPNPCHCACVPLPSACCLRLLPIYPCVHSSGQYWDSRHYFIDSYTVISFGPESTRQLQPNSCLRALVPHPSTSCLRLLSIYTRTWSSRVDVGDQGTTPSIPNTAESFDLKPGRQLRPNFCDRAFVPHPSACYLRLLTIYTCVHSLRRCWDPRQRAIYYYTDFSFDPGPKRILHSNSCHRAFEQHPSACCLRLLPIYPYVHSPGRCCNPRSHAISYNTDSSFDWEPTRQLQPNLPCNPCPTSSCGYS
jgi:hypothetical protein